MDCFPKSNPDVQHAQPRAQAAHKTTGEYGTQCGRPQQKIVVGPFRPPGKNDKQYPYHSTQKYKQQNQNATKPDLRA